MKKILFFGTSDFAVPSLDALAKDGRFEIAGVVTQPDRPVGRHAVLTAPPVKTAALSHAISEIHQPEKIKEETFQTWIRDIGPTCDAFVVVSYGKILPQWLLDLPKRGVINVHGSLLPRWRGASPIQSAIASGDTISGVTIMLLDAEMDHGPMIATAEENILPTDTGGELHDRLATLGADLLVSVLDGYIDGNIEPTEQDHDLATYCKILSREDGKLDVTKSAEELERLVRAYQPWPGTWIDVDGKRLKILASRIGTAIAADTPVHTPGARIIQNDTPAIICAGDTVLEFTHVQPEGKTSMTGEEFVRGFPSWTNN